MSNYKVKLENIAAGVSKNGIFISKDLMQKAITSFMEGGKPFGILQKKELSMRIDSICVNVNNIEIEENGDVMADISPTSNYCGKLLSAMMSEKENHKFIKFGVVGWYNKPKNNSQKVDDFVILHLDVCY